MRSFCSAVMVLSFISGKIKSKKSKMKETGLYTITPPQENAKNGGLRVRSGATMKFLQLVFSHFQEVFYLTITDCIKVSRSPVYIHLCFQEAEVLCRYVY